MIYAWEAGGIPYWVLALSLWFWNCQHAMIDWWSYLLLWILSLTVQITLMPVESSLSLMNKLEGTKLGLDITVRINILSLNFDKHIQVILSASVKWCCFHFLAVYVNCWGEKAKGGNPFSWTYHLNEFRFFFLCV